MELLKAETGTFEALLRLNTSADTDVKTIVLQELEYLNMAMLSNPKIANCIPATIVHAIKSVLKKNLSLDPSAGLVYIKTRSVEMTDEAGKKVWKDALEITDSANGIISVARQCGRVLDVKNPVVQKDLDGKVVGVSIEFLVPSIPSPRWDKREFDESDFWRWRTASHKERGRNKQDANLTTLNYANANYTSWKGGMDPEFARAKAVRHGIKKLGMNQNENRVTSITVPKPIDVVIDPEKDNESNETHYAEVIESTTNDNTVLEMPSAENL